MTTWDIELVREAWSLAAKVHDGQKSGGPEPGEYTEYLKHIGGVTLETMQALWHHPEADPDLAIVCAILHDTLEDGDISVETIAGSFGPAIASGVSALTKNTSLPTKHDQMLDSLQRIKKQPKEVWMVKLADRIINLSRPPFYWKANKIAAYQKEAQLIYDQLQAGSIYLSSRLQARIDAYSAFI